MLGYLAAQTGAFIAFIPLLTLLLPIRAESLAGPDKAILLGQAAMVGGLVAALANVAAGALSDRTRGRFGRRRPWLLGGVAGVALTLGLIFLAQTPTALILAVVGFQLAVNAVYGPLCALVPDMVPDSQKGLASSFASAALPLANLFTAVVVAVLLAWDGLAFAAVILASAVLILPLALTLREPERLTPRRLTFSFAAFRSRSFSLTFVSRLLAESGVAINTLYLLFLVQALPPGGAPQGWSAVQTFSALILAATLAATGGALAAGPLSDRTGRRAPFVIGGALGMAASLALLTLWTAWPGPLAAQLLFGFFHGVHAATVAAMTAEILPDREQAGRDLGMMNIAVALPQSLAPATAAGLIAVGADLSSVFVAAALACALAGLALTPLRRLRSTGR